ncbi:MAG: hypothetical protein AB1629_00770 [Candidatus Omnitrophota bacterium]
MKRIAAVLFSLTFITSLASAHDMKEVNKFLDKIETTMQADSIITEPTVNYALSQDRSKADEYLDEIEGVDQTKSNEEMQVIEPAIKYSFEVSPEYYHFRYEEPGIDIKEEGDMFGVNLAVSGHSNINYLMGKLEARFSAGRVDYDGSLSDGTPHTDEGDDYSTEIRALIGRDFKKPNMVLTPFFGFGYRYLNDQLESQYAYEREISYLYSPLGVETLSPLGKSCEWGLKLEYDIFWSGVVKSHLSDVNVAFNDLRNEQHEGYGARASIFLRTNIGERLKFSLEPFFRYWNIQDSDDSLITVSGTVVGVGREPANNTQEFGIRASLIW